MKTFSLSIIFSCFLNIFLFDHSTSSGFNLKQSLLPELQKKKVNTDKMVESHTRELMVLVKIPGQPQLVRIKSDKWPDEIECTYNILKNDAGNIIFVAKLLDSENGDWSITYKYYFDDQGNNYAFNYSESIVNDQIKGGEAHHTVLRYYDNGSKLISEQSRFTNKEDKVLKSDKSLTDQFHNNYITYKNLTDCLTGNNIHFH